MDSLKHYSQTLVTHNSRNRNVYSVNSVLNLLRDLRFRKLLVLAEAFGHLVVARAAVAALPFRWVAISIGSPRSCRTNPQPLVRSVCRTVTRVANRPRRWAICLPQALAAHWMLRRRGVPSTIQFGVQRGGDGLAAHAWLCTQGAIVLGAEGVEEFTVIAEFPNRTLKG